MLNKLKDILKRILLNPFIYIMIAVFLISAWILDDYGREFSESIAGLVFFTLIGLIMIPITLLVKAQPIEIRFPAQEAGKWSLYFLGWLVLNMLLWPSFFGTNNYYSNGLSFWGLLVLLPIIILWRDGRRWKDFGLGREQFLRNIAVALIAGAVIIAVLVMLTPGGRFIRSGEAELWSVAKGLGIAFLFSLIAAGFHEEFFFRGILQTRLSRFFNSEISGIIVATLMFGIYHLPFRFYMGISQGNLPHALAICFTETIFSAFILGILWSRTRSLIAPVLVHTLIDTISSLPMIMENFN